MDSADYDVLIHVGDIASDTYYNNGKKGDDYFDQMQLVFASRPVVFTVGNHENFDYFRMFNYRIKMPSTVTVDDNNFYIF